MANKVTVTTPGPAGPTGLTWRQTWASGTQYNFRDLIKYAVNGNVYFCTVAHTAGTILPTNTAYWNLFVSVEDSALYAITAKHTLLTDSFGNTAYSSKHYQEKSQDWAQKTDGQVTNDANNANLGYSAKEWATDTDANIGSAKDWAVKAGSAQVASSDYSSKAYAQDTSNDIGSAKDWAVKTSSQVASSDFSAKEYAVGTSTTSSKSYAVKVDGAVTGSDYSSKAWAVGGTGVTDTSNRGAAKEWATETASSVDTSEYSAKEYAVGIQRRGQANGGSAKDWATYTTGTVDNASYSALYHANAASASALAAKNSAAAVSNVYENFADTFLGKMADTDTASSGTANGTWTVNSSSITLASTSGTIEVGQEVTGSGIPADANVLSVNGSTIVISENMSAAGSAVALTFTGQGVFGAFNSTIDGPATDNDGDALATGMLYFNTSDNEMRVYDGATWVAASAAGSTSFNLFKFVATSGQTIFTGSDANSSTLSYLAGNINVFKNGVRVDESAFTATNGTSLVLSSAASTSDVIVIIAWKSFTVADTVSKASGGSFVGQVNFGGNGSSSGVSLTDGYIQMRTGTGNPAKIDMYCEVSNAHKVTLAAPPHSLYSGNVNFRLPPSNGSSDQILKTDGSGNTSWVTNPGVPTGKAIAMAIVFG